MNNLLLFLMLIFATNSYADTKISAMTEETSPALTDYTVTVNSTPANRKVKIVNAFKSAGMTVDGTNVGVGSINPRGTVDVGPSGTYYGDGSHLTGISGGGSGTVNTGAANFYGKYPSNGTTIDDSAVTMDDGVNVGISSAVPGSKLDVIGTVRATGFVGDGSLLTGVGGSISGLTTNKLTKATSSTTIGDSQITDTGTNIGLGTTAPQAFFTIGSTGNFQTNGSTTLWNSTSTTSAPFTFSANSLTSANGWIFQSSATSPSATLFSVTGSGASSTGAIMAIQNNSGTGPVVKFLDQQSDTTPFTVDSAGNVGIGTLFPQAQLDVRFQTPATPFQIGSSATDATGAYLLVNGSGNLGIGTINPGAKVDIFTGSIRDIGIGTTVPQQLCRKADGTFGYFDGAFTGACN